MSAEMCRLAADDGITHIVTTPHCNDHYWYDRGAQYEALEKLREATGHTMAFSLGCEFLATYENLQDLMGNPDNYTIGDTRYLLTELSDFSISPNLKLTLSQIRFEGIVPIIAHPERNPILQRRPEMVLDWINVGCLVQVTASALTGFWGVRPQKVAAWLLNNSGVHFLASDAHDPVHRTPRLREARQAAAAIVGEEQARFLVEDNPRAVVMGEPLPSAPQSCFGRKSYVEREVMAG
jgi:protein-tyrosine phosphatase